MNPICLLIFLQVFHFEKMYSLPDLTMLPVDRDSNLKIPSSPLQKETTIVDPLGIEKSTNKESSAQGAILVTQEIFKSESGIQAEFVSGIGDGGVIKVLMPNTSAPLKSVSHPVCYPETFLQHSEAAKLVHVLCKQMGHVTFGSRYKEWYPKFRIGVLSTSAMCTSLEDQVSQCPWSNVKTQPCKEVLAAKCTNCNHKILASNGSIHNPGYPHTYIYSITCEWTLEVPKNLGIELHFEQFTLPRDEKRRCESHIEVTYGYQKSLSIQKFCPIDHVQKMHIPFKSVRIRFSAGVFDENYEQQKTHYGFNIIFKATAEEKSSTQHFKIILITIACILLFIICIGCYCYCRSVNLTKITQRGPIQPLPPNAPTREQIQSAFEFQRCAMTEPEREPRFMSENSSADSNVTRWRTQSNIPVTSALAPLGPESRMVSIATTPRSVFPESRREWSKDSARKIEQLRTKLVARFSSSSVANRSDISVFLSASDRSSYSKLSCEEDTPLKSERNFKKRTSLTRSKSVNVPSIVVDLVK